jgi:CO dehydrogenase/acetyl-CoA synthase gamma subunit (corrinoid Fe-S protein)
VVLLVEKRMLEDLGYIAHLHFVDYQNLTISKEYIAKMMEAASHIPDEYVHKVMAIGDVDDVKNTIETLARAGVKHLVITDMLAPQGVGRTLERIKKVLKEFR